MKILICRPDKLGDLVLALNAIKQLKIIYPEYSISLHVSKYNKLLADNITFIDQVIDIDTPINENEFDCSIDLIAKYKFAIKYHKKTSLRIGNFARFFFFLYNKGTFIRRSKAKLNESEYNWKLIRTINDNLKYSNLYQKLNKNDFKEVKEYSFKTPYTVVMPGKSVSAINWGINNWVEFITKLSPLIKEDILVLLGPEEEGFLNIFENSFKTNPKIIIKKSNCLKETLGILSSASSYFGPSTGITHLASIFNLNGICIYPNIKSMHPKRWVPFNSSLKSAFQTKDLTPEKLVKMCFDENIYPELRYKVKKISAYIICKNEEKHIRKCLESIKWCDEIIIVDSGSTDNTLNIVKEYTDKIYHKDWQGYRKQKMYAENLCSNDWVINLDADEELSMELKGEIFSFFSTNKSIDFDGFYLNRLVYTLNTWWDKGGWIPEYRLRLYKKSASFWADQDIHEKVLVNGKTKKLTNFLYHYTFENFKTQLSLLNKYSTESAIEFYKNGKRVKWYNFILNPVSRFVKFYFLRKGFMHGTKGLIMAYMEANNTLVKYIKIYELQQK